MNVELIVVALVVGANTKLGTINVVGEGDGDATKNLATSVVGVSTSRIGLVVGVSKTLFLIVSKSCQEHKCQDNNRTPKRGRRVHIFLFYVFGEK